jgi:ankyrin repeat protein
MDVQLYTLVILYLLFHLFLVSLIRLNIACKEGHRDVAELLLKNNAEVNIRNSSNWTALDVATKNEHGYVIEILLKFKAV